MSADLPPYVPDELLGRLVGYRLHSVVFAMDYVQLCFDGPVDDRPVLSCFEMPAVEVASRTITPGTVGYADALTSLIEGDVLGTSEETGCGLRVEFAEGTVVVHPSVAARGRSPTAPPNSSAEVPGRRAAAER